jgi:hypothetical protein
MSFQKEAKNEILNGLYDCLVNENIIYGIQQQQQQQPSLTTRKTVY